jgi:hypothetical protein
VSWRRSKSIHNKKDIKSGLTVILSWVRDQSALKWNHQNKSAFRFCFGVVTSSIGPLGRVSRQSPLGATLGVTHTLILYLFSSRCHIMIWFCLDHIFHQTVSSFIRLETPPSEQYSFDYVFPVLACVLDYACKDKPSW